MTYRLMAIEATSTIFRRNLTILTSSSHRHNYCDILLIFFVYYDVKLSKLLDSFVRVQACAQTNENL
ncbi:hypothetical protein BO443_140073 [Burkholderia orbicola]